MVKILLIQPNYRNIYSYAGSKNITPISPPLGLAYIAAVVRENGFDVKIIEANALNLKHYQIKKEILKYNPDYVAMTASSSLINEVNKLANLCPQNVKIILGGIHASSMPEEILRDYKRIDIIVRREGEETIINILKGIPLEKIDGISFRKKNKIIHNKDSEFIEDLDSLPFPARDLLPMNKYFSFGARKYPIDYIVTGRGCPYHCIFCLHPNTNIITDKGILKIVDMDQNTKVLTHKGRLKEKKAFFKRKYMGILLNIRTKYFLDPIKITPNHKIYAIKNNEIKTTKVPYLIEASRLNEKDYLAMPIPKIMHDIRYLKLDELLPINQNVHKPGKKLSKDIIDKILSSKGIYSTRKIAKSLKVSKSAVANYIKYGNKGNFPIILKKLNDFILYSRGKNKVLSKIKLTPDLCRLFGYYLAEGHVSFLKHRPNSGLLCFTFHFKEEEYIKDVSNLIKKYFKLSPRITHLKENNTKQIWVSNAILANLFKTLFNSGSENKRIYPPFLYLPRNKIKQLLKGYFRGDGNQNYNNLRVTSISRELIEQIKFLSLRLEMMPSEYKRNKEDMISKIKGRQIIAKHDSYELVFRGKNAKELYNLLEKKYPYKSIRSWKEAKITDEFFLVPIKSIKKENYNGFVYNISVEDDVSYTANNIAVSNCADYLTSGRKLRMRSAENIIKEIEFLIKSYKVKEIDFQDDNFTLNHERVNKFCDLMIKKGLNKYIIWKVSNGVRCDRLTLPLLKKMKKAGCYMLALGIESGNQEILNKMKKLERLEDIKNAVKWCKKARIETRGLFIFGLPGENEKTMQDTINFAKSLPLDTASFHIAIPMPKTEFWDIIEREGKFLDINWENYTAYSEGTFTLRDVNPELMQRMVKKAFKEFYMRPSYVVRRFLKIRSPNDLKIFIKMGLEGLKTLKNLLLKNPHNA